jgi:glycosyltransferase involved in cell wall biosynthesis
MTEHTEAPWRGPLDRAISRSAYRRADGIIAVSTAIRQGLVKEFGVPPSRVTYVPNAVVPLADPAVRRALPARSGLNPVIGRVSRLAPEKGVDVFLRAAARVAECVPGATFVVVGDGPLRDDLVGLADELSIADRVHFLGQRADARAVIAGLDVLVVSSITDGSPLVALEAMAAGTPIVASACGGIPDQIRCGVDGLLVPPGDAGALARATVAVVTEPGLAGRLAASARRRAEAEFSYEGMLARVEDCYRLVATAPDRARSVEDLPLSERAAGA